ncbi:MAG: hypothetical protein HYX75_25285 [Acidobacteria bacterium]|nr:hypothetical protein [Acidobacteriota bacterium]
MTPRRAGILAATAVLIASLLIAFVCWFPLSLGPRVVLEPYLLTQGFSHYTDIVDQHEPALTAVVVLLIRAGLSPITAATAVFLAIQGVIVVSLLLVGRRFGEWVGVLAVLLYAASAPGIVQGKLWYDMAMGPLLVAAAALLMGPSPPSRRRSVLSGLALGLAFLVKQHAVIAIGLVLVWLVLEWGVRHGLPAAIRLLAAASALPAAHLLWRLSTGSLRDYLHWCWFINDRYLNLAVLWPTRAQLVELIPLALLLSLSLTLWRNRSYRLMLLMAAGAAALAFPRYAHFHLAAALPLLSLLAAMTVRESLRRHGIVAGFLDRITIPRPAVSLIVIGLAFASAHPWLKAGQAVRVEEYDPLEPLGQILEQRLPEGRSMVIFPEDEAVSNLYIQAGRYPPGHWMLTYPWYIEPAIIERLIADLSRADLVVFFPGRELQGRLPEDYMRPYYEAILEQFPVVEESTWEQGRVMLRTRRL